MIPMKHQPDMTSITQQRRQSSQAGRSTCATPGLGALLPCPLLAPFLLVLPVLPSLVSAPCMFACLHVCMFRLSSLPSMYLGASCQCIMSLHHVNVSCIMCRSIISLYHAAALSCFRSQLIACPGGWRGWRACLTCNCLVLEKLGVSWLLLSLYLRRNLHVRTTTDTARRQAGRQTDRQTRTGSRTLDVALDDT